MDDLISRYELLNRMKENRKHYMRHQFYNEAEAWNTPILLVAEAPAVDAAPVIHCRECKYYEYGKDYLPYCNCPDGGIADYPEKDDFCSYGKSRED